MSAMQTGSLVAVALLCLGCWRSLALPVGTPAEGCGQMAYDKDRERAMANYERTARPLIPLDDPQIMQWGMSDESKTPPAVPLDTAPVAEAWYLRREVTGEATPSISSTRLTLESGGQWPRPASRDATATIWTGRGHATVVRTYEGVEFYSVIPNGERRTEYVATSAQPRPALQSPAFHIPTEEWWPSVAQEDRLEGWLVVQRPPLGIVASDDQAFQLLWDPYPDPLPRFIKVPVKPYRDYHPLAPAFEVRAPPPEEHSDGYRCDLVHVQDDAVLTVHHLAVGTAQDSRWRVHAMRYDSDTPYAGLVGYGIRHVAAALDRRGMVIATDKGIVWTDMALRPTHERLVAMNPVSIRVRWDDSIDIVTANPALLLRFDSHGRSVFWTALPGEPSGFPPTAGRDGGTRIPMRDRIVQVDASGVVEWELPRDSETPIGDHGLVSDDRRVLAMDADGSTRELWVAPARLTSAPHYAFSGNVMVTTATDLFELTLD